MMQITFTFCDPAPVIKINPNDVIIVGGGNRERIAYMVELTRKNPNLRIDPWDFSHNGYDANTGRSPKLDAYKNTDRKHIARMKRVQAYLGWTPEPEAE